MNDKQENKLSMYNAVKRVLNMFTSRWSGLAGFAKVVSAYTNTLTALETNASLQKKNISGITIDKRDLKETLSDYAHMVAGAVHAYAQSIGNDELRKIVAFVRSDFTRMRDEVIDKEARNIHSAATEQLANLEGYGITQAVVDTLKELIDKYHEKTPQTRTALSARNTYTKAIDTLSDETDLILEGQLDKMMLQFKSTDEGATPRPAEPAAESPADFYELYVQAREIIDLGKRTFHLQDFVIPKGGSITIEGAVDQQKAKNTGNTILEYHDSAGDNLIALQPGEEVIIQSPSGKIIVTNRSATEDGKFRVNVFKK